MRKELGLKMYKIFVFAVLIFSSHAIGDEPVEWPDLSTIKFVSQRSATEIDINNGAAVFLLESEGANIGSPIDIVLPQYAIHTDGDSGEKNNVVVIQAEEANGQQVIGAFIFDEDEYIAGLANEFSLLGQSKPN